VQYRNETSRKTPEKEVHDDSLLLYLYNTGYAIGERALFLSRMREMKRVEQSFRGAISMAW
jgi:hypothetical protein